MDQRPQVAHRCWLAVAFSTVLYILLLWTFEGLSNQALVQASEA